jgi:hypothetical protein
MSMTGAHVGDAPLTFDNLVFTEVYVRAAGAWYVSRCISAEGSNAPPATGGPLSAKTRKDADESTGTSMALSVLMMMSFAQAEGNAVVPSVDNAEQTMTEQMSGAKGGHLSAGGRITDILNNPAFVGFGSFDIAAVQPQLRRKHAAEQYRLTAAVSQSCGSEGRCQRSESHD